MSYTTDRNAPPIEAARLWQKTSANGNRYLIGRLGGLRVLIFENRKREDDTSHTHILCISQAPPHDSRTVRERAETAWQGQPRPAERAAAARQHQRLDGDADRAAARDDIDWEKGDDVPELVG